jgi:hypothetical protein
MIKGVGIILMVAGLLTAAASILSMKAASLDAANQLRRSSELSTGTESGSPLCEPRVPYATEFRLDGQPRVLQVPLLMCP